VLYVIVAVSLFLVTWSGMRPLVRMLPAMFPKQSAILQWGFAAVVALPFLFLISRTLERLILQIASLLFRRGATEAVGQTQFVRRTLYFLFGWIAGVFVLAACSPVLPPQTTLAVVGAGLLILSYVFWESLGRFHEQIERVLDTLSGESSSSAPSETSRQVEQRQALTQLLRDQYGLAVQTEDFVVPFFPSGLNQPIRSLRLRTLSGASIMAIYRDPEQIVIPQADTVLLPGDVLVLLGERDQLESALRFLTELASPTPQATAPPRIETLIVQGGSSFASRTLGDIGRA
jgi:K+/H+ antiporter YhaU regulatory subunit KhtT